MPFNSTHNSHQMK